MSECANPAMQKHKVYKLNLALRIVSEMNISWGAHVDAFYSQFNSNEQKPSSGWKMTFQKVFIMKIHNHHNWECLDDANKETTA